MKLFTEGSVGLGANATGTLGEEWVVFVKAWSVFQTNAGFDKSANGRLPSQNRPVVVKNWIARARSVTYRPDIGSLTHYEKGFNSWWTSMQPPWRMVNGRLDKERTDGDWSALNQPGPNGLLNVVAALYFWGRAAYGGKHEKAWKAAVKDCTAAFQALL
ncbi:hypothetical protein CVT24_012820 [Panaeolus cyanescens]|uniref:Uncharacterized protein n=1 Tax=Panaeolus cyanescens TaxID=181874 RepID=A0A409YJN9_9AGAR|nr:hypothetical protein CVT24_012820 [Panaeolus cyanescens]